MAAAAGVRTCRSMREASRSPCLPAGLGAGSPLMSARTLEKMLGGSDCMNVCKLDRLAGFRRVSIDSRAFLNLTSVAYVIV